MADIPDDLTSIGTHQGNQPPTDTGQTVRSPEGPDPSDEPSEPSPALFQVIRAPSEDQIQVRTHSPRAVVSEPDDGNEIDQCRSVEALREALANASIEGWTAVFEDTAAHRVLLETNVDPDHAWIGQPRYSTITFFAEEADATAYAEKQDRPTPNQ